MKCMPTLLMAAALLALPPCSSRAEIHLVIINRNCPEIDRITMKAERGTTYVVSQLVPGCDVSLESARSSRLQSLTLDTGIEQFRFDNLDLGENPTLVLQAVLKDDRPLLLPNGVSVESLTGPAEAFDIETDPIANHEAAKTVCPEVLAAWSAEHGNRQVEWTGHWTNLAGGRKAVCNAREKNAGSELPEDVIVGSRISLLDEEARTDLASVLAARSMSVIERYGAVDSPRPSRAENELMITTLFADRRWNVFASPDGENYPATLLAFCAVESTQEIFNTLDAVGTLGLRPWSATVYSGSDMEARGFLAFADANFPDEASAIGLLKEATKEMYTPQSIGALDILLVPRNLWEEIVGGSVSSSSGIPGIILRVASGGILRMERINDATALVARYR